MTDPSRVVIDSADDELLEWYLSLSEKQRDQEFLSTERAAEISGMSQRTIQHWVETGELSAIFLGRKCLVHHDSLRAYLKRRNNDR
jgi:excisionase family DNA binding protein